MSKRPPPPPRGEAKKYCKATWDYNANEPGELSFKLGDIITVIKEDPSGWWIGSANGAEGQFPANFTEPFTPSSIPVIASTPAPTPLVLSTEDTSTSAAPPMLGGANPLAELKAKLANRSTVAPGEIKPIKKEEKVNEDEKDEGVNPFKAHLKPTSGPCKLLPFFFPSPPLPSTSILYFNRM